jgi:hypothetical protein
MYMGGVLKEFLSQRFEICFIEIRLHANCLTEELRVSQVLSWNFTDALLFRREESRDQPFALES